MVCSDAAERFLTACFFHLVWDAINDEDWVSSDFEKLVIVTGAGSGMGAVTARRFRDEGAAVVLTGSQLDQERRLIHVSKSDEQQDSARQY